MAGRRVLYVTADESAVADRVEALENDEFRMETVSNPEPGPELARSDEVGCVLSDRSHPKGDGIAFLSRVRSARPELPTVLLTPTTAADVLDRALDAGVTDYVPTCFPDENGSLIARRIRTAIATGGRRATFGTALGSPRADPPAGGDAGDPSAERIPSAIRTTEGDASPRSDTEPPDSPGFTALVRSALEPDSSGTRSTPDPHETAFSEETDARPADEGQRDDSGLIWLSLKSTDDLTAGSTGGTSTGGGAAVIHDEPGASSSVPEQNGGTSDPSPTEAEVDREPTDGDRSAAVRPADGPGSDPSDGGDGATEAASHGFVYGRAPGSESAAGDSAPDSPDAGSESDPPRDEAEDPETTEPDSDQTAADSPGADR